MSTTFSFSSQIYISDIPMPAASVGAHLAAKLELFGTDERTLTDELCDMLCIWLNLGSILPHSSSATSPKFTLTLGKTTAADEAKNGADLDLTIQTPLGVKRSLMQAKVVGPTNTFRRNSKNDWEKLRNQLKLARANAGDLACLLIYFPSNLLNSKIYGFSTYEHGSLPLPRIATKPAYYGVTVIPVNELLGPSGRWRTSNKKKLATDPINFKGNIPFWRFLMELMLCRRSTWSRERNNIQIATFRKLSLIATEISEEQWQELQLNSDRLLEPQSDPERNF